MMRDNDLIRPDTIVDDLLTTYPQTAEVFVRRAMVCVGCTISAFHTVAEAAAVYHLNLDEFLADLHGKITASIKAQD
jgi:hybrid cluster-associated redox disulfide protein